MKTSIKKLLSSFQFNAVLLMLFSIIAGVMLASSMATFGRIDNLLTQERMVKSIAAKNRQDSALDRIQVNGVLGRLPLYINDFKSSEPYEFVNALLIGEAPQRAKVAQTLQKRYETLSAKAKPYFDANPDVQTPREQALLAAERKAMLVAVDSYVFALYPATKLQNSVLRSYAMITAVCLAVVLLWSFILIVMAGRTSKLVLADINTILQQDPNKPSTEKLNTNELNAVAVKIRQEGSESTLSPSKKDEVTQLPNYEGFKSAFDRRPQPPKNISTFVCIFEIDNYTKLINHFPQSIIDPVMIKIATIMKLHKMQNDLIGRIDGSHFIAVFTRQEKQKALGDADHIRQMIEENRFKLPQTNYHITISGGFTVKMSSQTIDDAVKNAREYLKLAQEKGGNTIAEGKNNPKIL